MQRFPGSGRPRTVRVLGNIFTVEDLFLSQENDHVHANSQVIERTTGISCSSVCRMAKNYIGLRVFKEKKSAGTSTYHRAKETGLSVQENP